MKVRYQIGSFLSYSSGDGVLHAVPVARPLRLLRLPLGQRERPAHHVGTETTAVR